MKMLACVAVVFVIAGCEKPTHGVGAWNAAPSDRTALINEASTHLGTLTHHLDGGSAWFGLFVKGNGFAVLRMPVQDGVTIEDFKVGVAFAPTTVNVSYHSVVEELHTELPSRATGSWLRGAEVSHYDVNPQFKGTLIVQFQYTLRKDAHWSNETGTFNVSWPP